MRWDIAVEYPATQSGLWSYPYASYTLGGLPIMRIFVVGFTGFMLFTINSAIESRNFRLAQEQVKSSSQMPPEIKEKSWAWNIFVRVISFNIIVLSWIILVFGEE